MTAKQSTERKVLYASVDTKYAHVQVRLDERAAKQCKFQIMADLFVTGHHGLTKLPTGFQKLMEITRVNMDCLLVYIDDILNITKSEKKFTSATRTGSIQVLDKDNLQL